MKRWLRRIGVGLLVLVLGVSALFAFGWWYFHPATEDVIQATYSERNGKPLTYEVHRPAHGANGAAILVVVSGSWKSGPDKFRGWFAAPFLRRGYSVVAVSHLSQPRALIGEIADDMQRAVRHVRHRAGDYGIDPDRIGVTGASSGGHLSLMLATCGGDGRSNSEDEVDRESSAVQSVAVFFPVTDLLNLGDSTENPGDGGPPMSFGEGFGPGAKEMPKWKEIGRALSPIYHIGEEMPPVFIVHGNADTLVPLDQSVRFRDAAANLGKEVELLIRPDKGHGWASMIGDLWLFADWFDATLGEKVRR